MKSLPQSKTVMNLRLVTHWKQQLRPKIDPEQARSHKFVILLAQARLFGDDARPCPRWAGDAPTASYRSFQFRKEIVPCA